MEEELDQKIERTSEDFYQSNLSSSFMTKPEVRGNRSVELGAGSMSSSGDPKQRPEFKIKSGNPKPQSWSVKSKSVAKEPSKSTLPKPAEASPWLKKMEDMRARMNSLKKELVELESGKWKEDFDFPDCIDEFEEEELENIE